MPEITADTILLGVFGLMLLMGAGLGIRQLIVRPHSVTDADEELVDPKRGSTNRLPAILAGLLCLGMLVAAAFYFTPIGAFVRQQFLSQPVAVPIVAATVEATVQRLTVEATVAQITPTALDIATIPPTELPKPNATATEIPTSLPSPVPSETALPTATAETEVELPTVTPTIVAAPTEIVLRDITAGELYAFTVQAADLRDLPRDDGLVTQIIPTGLRVIVVGRQRELTWVKVELGDMAGWTRVNAVSIDGDIRRVRVVRN